MTLTEAAAALAAALQSRAGTGASLTPELRDLLQAAALPAGSPGALADAVVASLTGISAADKQVSPNKAASTGINSKVLALHVTNVPAGSASLPSCIALYWRQVLTLECYKASIAWRADLCSSSCAIAELHS